ncbi:predicted protein [Naegleria gruberi]|uniref:Predicted protein n=1 Tax=Naegleria gruberi TaxID=5762 RepID=D2V811_NAEGR|nr:uncharacterized protein NAEGRDRAFT_64989 [Naegleria gruberi]EFC46962.1 predicted protein [Naegleria gruberi]|eukprot:XP_002679706.1 predicted protein [Naegleria gruberi strain NEG-M]
MPSFQHQDELLWILNNVNNYSQNVLPNLLFSTLNQSLPNIQLQETTPNDPPDIFSSNILFTVWSWCVEYAPALNVQNSEISNVTWILSHLFAHGNFAFALCSATWSVSIAVAIYATTKKVKWMEENYVYDILFHIISWGVALISFISVFTYRVSAKLTGFHDQHPDIENYILTFFNFFGAFYLIIAAVVDFSILYLIWKHVGNVLSRTQLRIVVKQETKRAQRRIIGKLSLYLVPFIFVPMQGFLNFLVFGLTLGRSALVKLLRCDCLRGKYTTSEERESLLSINNTMLNSLNSNVGVGRERSASDDLSS